MARATSRPFGYYVIKAIRVTGWFLLALMVLYIISGYALAEEFGCHRIMGEKLAMALHVNWQLDRVLVVLVVVHAGGASYLAMRRRGWIKPRRKT